MELKKYEEYTEEEKIELLNHWFIYYGKVLFTLEELDVVQALIKKNPDRIFDYIMTGYIVGDDISPTVLLSAIENGNVKTFLDTIPHKKNLNKKTQESYDHVLNYLLSKFVESYNNPEPPVAMDVEVIIEENPKKY